MKDLPRVNASLCVPSVRVCVCLQASQLWVSAKEHARFLVDSQLMSTSPSPGIKVVLSHVFPSLLKQ